MIDYAALAKKHGGKVAEPSGSIDYAALAEKHGGKVGDPGVSAINAANSKYTVNPNGPVGTASGRYVDRIGSNIKDLASGLGSAALDALKSATTLEGQVSYLPRMAKNMYEGAVNYTSDAIARQLPNGAEDITPEQAFRASVAAVPVAGGYLTNRATDIEEGRAPEAFADITTDALAALIPGSKAGRGATGAAIRLADGKILKPITRGLKPFVKRGAEMGIEMAPEAIGAVAGGALGGPTGAAAGALSGKALKDAYRAVKESGEAAKATPVTPMARPKASAEQIKAAVEAGPRGNAAKRAMREAKEARAEKAAEAQAKKDAGKAKFEAAKEAAKPKAEAPKADKPPTVTVPGETGQRVVSVAEEVTERRPSLPQPDPSKAVAGKDPFKLGNRIYSAPEGAKRTRISEYYSIDPAVSVAEGATGVHPTLGLPMRADGKVLVRNVEDFGSTPGRAPSGAPVWRDPDARFGKNQTVNEVAEMLEARPSASTSISDLQKQLEAATKRQSSAGKSPAQAKFEEAKAKQKTIVKPDIVDRIGKAISPDAAWKDLQKHGAGDGKRIPKDEARQMVDMVWKDKDPGYTSIEQWMLDRKEKWDKMRTSSKKKGTP